MIDHELFAAEADGSKKRDLFVVLGSWALRADRMQYAYNPAANYIGSFLLAMLN
eukprot:SAG22_NODE_16953_length_314_cov_0.720930_1_plen_53_part_01